MSKKDKSTTKTPTKTHLLPITLHQKHNVSVFLFVLSLGRKPFINARITLKRDMYCFLQSAIALYEHKSTILLLKLKSKTRGGGGGGGIKGGLRRKGGPFSGLRD